jgi:hypothetical protein
MFTRALDDGVDLRFSNLMRIHAAEPLTLRVHQHLDAERLGGLLVKD